jgi:membrane protein
VRQIRYIFHVGLDAFYTFLADDGWAIASHIALSTLMALFPFLIVLTSLAGFFGSKELADQAAGLLLQVWPRQVADSLSGEIHDVLTTTRGDILTIGAVLAVYFASNGVEALRVALNRAYAVIEPRRWYWLRLESIGYTLVAAFTSLAMAFLIVLGPLMIEGARRHIPIIVETNENLHCPLQRHNLRAGGCAVRAACVAAIRPPVLLADPAGHRLHPAGFADLGHRIWAISGAFRQ